MKNIAILVSELTTDYNLTVLEGIEDFFKDKPDVHYIISSLLPAKAGASEFDYQFMSSYELFKSPDIDAVLLITNSFFADIDYASLSKKIQELSGKPVFSVSSPLDAENVYYTHVGCTEAIDNVVAHLKEKHGKKKIGCITAGLVNSPDSNERLEAYKEALRKNGFEYDPSIVYDSDFTPGTTQKVLDIRFKKKEDVPFDALVCFNDYMAGGALLSLKRLGLDVPNDIAVTGFDDCSFALLTTPTLTSINQSISGTGRKTAEMAYRYLCGQQVNTVETIQAVPIYRQSCGCITTDLDTSAYIDSKGTYHRIDDNISKQTYGLLSTRISQIQIINSMLNIMNARVSFSNLQESLHKAMTNIDISTLFVCLYDMPVECRKNEEFRLPEQARLVLRATKADAEDLKRSHVDGIAFNPREHLLPPEFMDSEPGKYYLLPIFMHEMNYGYIYCRLSQNDDSVIPVALKILTNVLINAMENQKEIIKQNQLISKNQSLNMQSKTDELTQILNRRGFFEYGQQLLDMSIASGKDGIVFFCDLDGLKGINDTYGHEMGDLAIRTEAQVLKSVFRGSDLVGRLSGDEFGAVAPGFPIDKLPMLRERILETNERMSKIEGLPFTLSISVGPASFDAEHADLRELLAQADENLYKEKQIKHQKKKNDGSTKK